MFCPSCGSEDRQTSQYCRACGADLRVIRQGLERPEVVMASAVSARDEIGRAIAARIREVRDAGDLKIVEDLLPEVEKFFESPQERRLRRIRTGVITAMVGLGAAIFFLVFSAAEQGKGLEFMIAGGGVAFLIGLGIVINGLLFTVPKENWIDRNLDSGDEKKERPVVAADTLEELPTVRRMDLLGSVTEHTTHRLPNETVQAPEPRAESRMRPERNS